MTIAVIALAAAFAALAVVGLTTLGSRRARRESEQRVRRALGEMGHKMEALSGELADAIERAQDDGPRTPAIDGLGPSLDLDEVLAQTVDAAAALPGADASVVRAQPPDGPPLVVARGISAARGEAQAITGPPDGMPVRAVALSYHYRPGVEHEQPLRSAIAVPLETKEHQLGFLAVYSRSVDAPIGPEDFGTLEAIADQAGRAIEQAPRCGEAPRQDGRDALTGLHNRSAFHETLARDVARAHRHEARLALCVLDVDDFKTVNDRLGQLGGDTVLARVAESVLTSVGDAGLACRIGGDEFAVILHAAGRTDAEALFVRVQATLRRAPAEQAPGLTVSGGITELRHDDDALALFERAEAALGRAKAGGKGKAS